MKTYSIHLEQFQGPLDLLLQLIEQQKLSINEISLAAIAEQYLAYLQTVEERFPDELADFLLVATKLLLIKSRSLLPYLQIEDDEPEGNIEEQLKIYKVFYEASKGIDQQLQADQCLFSRPPISFRSVEPVFAPPFGLSLGKLKEWMISVLEALEPMIALPKHSLAKAVTLQEKILDLEQRLIREISLSFHRLMKNATSRTDVILTFLALLELVKQRSIVVEQDQLFSDISIKKQQPS